jgi:signal transduction histidine kinase
LEQWQYRRPLFAQMRWFIRLRWAAATAVLLAAAALALWHAPAAKISYVLWIGLAIFSYNILHWIALHFWSRWSQKPAPLVLMAWLQIVLDLGSLTLLTLGTGGVLSPLLGLFVFHMVFASLLLPQAMAFGGAAVAVAMLGGGLVLTGQFPQSSDPLAIDHRLILAGWVLTLLLTVYVANVITLDLRHHRRRLIRKNQRIRAIKNQLQRQQQVLVQQEKMAGLGQMAAGVAHEISNPLASMDSLLQLMARKPERLTSANVETLRQQVQRIHQTVQQMTAFSHPVEHQWQTLSVNEVVDEALKLVRMDPRLRKAKIVEELGSDVGAVPLLPHALQQVLVNLLLNALDATAQAAEPRLAVKTARNDRWCCIEVSDNGHGISQANLSRVFEPFFTTKPVGQGTGLGLSISYTLMRQQGGDIHAPLAAQAGEQSSAGVRVESFN